MAGPARHTTNLSKVYPTYLGPGPHHGTLHGYAKGLAGHLFVILCWQGGLLLNVFNLMQPTPTPPQLAVAIPVTAAVWYGIYLATGSSLELAGGIIGILIVLCALPHVGLGLGYTRWVHQLLVDTGDYYQYGAHTCFEFELSDKLPRGIWCYHPHGMFSWFMAATHLRHTLQLDRKWSPSPVPHQGLAVRLLCDSPLFRHFIVDTVRSTWPADRKGMLELVKRGEAMALIPGGFHEAGITCRGLHRAYILHKKGFVKVALRYGYALYPSYVFGESDTYYNPQGLTKLRVWLAEFNVPAIIPCGRWFFPPLPRRDLGLYHVVGSPILLPKLEDPTNEELDKYHTQYVQALRELFDRNKAHFGLADAQLEVM
jgi:2-acylglycerol O-acyltransferase 2